MKSTRPWMAFIAGFSPVVLALLRAPALAQDPEARPAPPVIPAPRVVDPASTPGQIPPPPPKDLPPILGAVPSMGGPLGLDEVLDSVEQNYPLLRAIEQERSLAGGKLVSAMGAFDLNLNASADGVGPATYDSVRGNLGVNQATQNGGHM